MIGFGEAARAFVEGWRKAGGDYVVTAYDLKTAADVPDGTDAMWRAYRDYAVAGCATPGEALARADLVFCLVTADQAEAAARVIGRHVAKGALFFDGNSCAPMTKRRSAAHLAAAGARYVDMAIMAPVHPRLHETPLFLSGPHATAGQAALVALGMAPKAVAGDVGHASAIKMVRSIMVKGLEALVAETVLAGRLAGVEAAVLDSLEASYPGFGWRKRSRYNLERMMRHGPRRAAEMDEVVRMLKDLGLGGGMAEASAGWQRRIGALALGAGADDLDARADRILSGLGLLPVDEAEKQGEG